MHYILLVEQREQFMDKQKHLEFIQGVINRMSNCSFLIKGWTITIIAAVFGLAAKDADIKYIIIAYMVIPFFWLLDAFFLSKERQYRSIYNHVRLVEEKNIDFSMETETFNTDKNTWIRSFFSGTLNTFYIPLVVIVLIIMFIFTSV